jgi:hypothetical protein
MPNPDMSRITMNPMWVPNPDMSRTTMNPLWVPNPPICHAVGAHPADAQPADAQSIDAHLAGAPPHAAPHPAPTLGAVVGAFKSLATVEYARGVEAEGWPAFEGRLWQRNYYEQIIRDEAMWVQARRYIHDNAAHWPEDQETPEKAAP